jgi:hypothetical protein
MNSYCSAGRPSIYDINQDRVGQQVQKEDHSISSTGKFGNINKDRCSRKRNRNREMQKKPNNFKLPIKKCKRNLKI